MHDQCVRVNGAHRCLSYPLQQRHVYAVGMPSDDNIHRRHDGFPKKTLLGRRVYLVPVGPFLTSQTCQRSIGITACAQYQ